MSKLSEMAATIEELRTAAAAINEAADWLAHQFSGEPVKEETPAAYPAPTLEEVRAVLSEKSRAGFTAQVKALLQAHGADRLSAVSPSEYAALLKEAEALGNG